MKTARQLNIEHLVRIRDSMTPRPHWLSYDMAPLEAAMHKWIAVKYNFTELQAVMNTWHGEEFSPYVSMNS